MVFASPIFLFLFLPLDARGVLRGAARAGATACCSSRASRSTRGARRRTSRWCWARSRSTTRSARAIGAQRRPRSRASAGSSLGVAGNLAALAHLQVRELRGRQRQRARADPRDHAARARGHSAAARHLVLHVPRDLVRRRRLQGQRARGAQPAALRALHPAVSAAHRRARSSAGATSPRSCRCASSASPTSPTACAASCSASARRC